MANEDLLAQVPLFQRFSPADLRALAGICSDKKFPAGAYVFNEGSKASSMLILRSGLVEVVKEGKAGSQFVVAQIGTGALLGEMAYVDRARRAASAVIKEPVDALEIRFDDLDALLKKEQGLGLMLYQSIAETLCARIRKTTTDFSSLLLS